MYKHFIVLNILFCLCVLKQNITEGHIPRFQILVQERLSVP